jgi:hypothetical protein
MHLWMHEVLEKRSNVGCWGAVPYISSPNSGFPFHARATPLFTIALELPSLSRCLNRYARCMHGFHAKG